MSIKIECVDVQGWESALRGMRNPLNSWDKADTMFKAEYDTERAEYVPEIGDSDLSLMKRLSSAGTDHAKYERFIDVTCDITAPLYWHKEMDTYRMGVEKNSCSTMHKIQSKEFTLEDFSCEHLLEGHWLDNLKSTINELNYARECFLSTKDKVYWWQMIQLLPSSYNQKRTYKISYQALKNMYLARRNHKLDEWHTFCEWAETLPYFREILGDVNET